jgi:hypothetical protein
VHALIGHQSLEHGQAARPHPHDGDASDCQDKPCDDAIDAEGGTPRRSHRPGITPGGLGLWLCSRFVGALDGEQAACLTTIT